MIERKHVKVKIGWMAAMMAVCAALFIGCGGRGDDVTPRDDAASGDNISQDGSGEMA